MSEPSIAQMLVGAPTAKPTTATAALLRGLLEVALAITNPNASVTPAPQVQGTKTVTTAGTPVPLVATTTLVDFVIIQAVRSRTAPNTGVIYYGVSATAANNVLQIPIGQTITIQAPQGRKIDLHTIYIDAGVNGDGVSWTTLN